MNGIYLTISACIAFFITWLLGKIFIPYLHKLNYGQTIREVGPTWHKNKQGTPTMGGIIFIIGIVVATTLTIFIYQIVGVDRGFVEVPLLIIKVISGLTMSLCFGMIGFVDDYIKVVKKRNLGLTSIQKLVLQFTIAFGYLISLNLFENLHGSSVSTSIFIPMFGIIDFGILYWPICVILIVGLVNAVNLTDGIDGLNSSVTFFNAIFLMIIAGILNMTGFGIFSAALAGGCLGFLLWNIHPAKVFMGDTGSLFLGGAICALIFGMDIIGILPIIGAIYMIEMFSIIAQVAYFKITKGKRIFKMTPIHHHFEMSGFNEYKICGLFSMTTVFFGIITILIVKFWMI